MANIASATLGESTELQCRRTSKRDLPILDYWLKKDPDIKQALTDDQKTSRDLLRDKIFILLTEDGAFVGFVGYYMIKLPNKMLPATQIYIAQNFRGRGLGRKALKIITDKLSLKGYKEILTVTKTSNKGMQVISERLGYRLCGTSYGCFVYAYPRPM